MHPGTTVPIPQPAPSKIPPLNFNLDHTSPIPTILISMHSPPSTTCSHTSIQFCLEEYVNLPTMMMEVGRLWTMWLFISKEERSLHYDHCYCFFVWDMIPRGWIWGRNPWRIVWRWEAQFYKCAHIKHSDSNMILIVYGSFIFTSTKQSSWNSYDYGTDPPPSSVNKAAECLPMPSPHWHAHLLYGFPSKGKNPFYLKQEIRLTF